jgi:hypothetical protein
MMLIKKDKCFKIFGERRVALPAHPAGYTRLYGHPVPNLKNQTDTLEVLKCNNDIQVLCV